MTFGLVLTDNASLDILCLIFVVETEKDEAEATTTLGQFLSHDYCVLDLAKLLEV